MSVDIFFFFHCIFSRYTYIRTWYRKWHVFDYLRIYHSEKSYSKTGHIWASNLIKIEKNEAKTRLYFFGNHKTIKCPVFHVNGPVYGYTYDVQNHRHSSDRTASNSFVSAYLFGMDFLCCCCFALCSKLSQKTFRMLNLTMCLYFESFSTLYYYLCCSLLCNVLHLSTIFHPFSLQ